MGPQLQSFNWVAVIISAFLLISLLVLHSHSWDLIYWTTNPSSPFSNSSNSVISVHIVSNGNSRQSEEPNNRITTVSYNPSKNVTGGSSVSFLDAIKQSIPSAIPSSLPIVSAARRQDIQVTFNLPHEKQNTINLRKLESDLRLARAAVRRVAMFKKYNSSRFKAPQRYSDEEPFGTAYRDAAIFRESYLQMEKRFKIFVYREGEEPLVHDGPCKEIYAIEGRFIREFQGKNSFITTDPEKAHAFFLPFSVTWMVSFLHTRQSRSIAPLLHFVRDYIDVVSANHPFWNRSEGADHFMLSCHDWGPVVSKAHPNLERKAIRLLCNANLSEGYIPRKDASLPEINLIGGTFASTLGGKPANQRTHLAFFAGGNHGPVRPILFKYWEGKDEDVLVFRKLPKKYSYHDLMKSSRYCICPGGYEVNSPRIVEAIYNECVPVILADGFVLPFSDVLDWTAFSLHLPEKDIPNLKVILSQVPTNRYEEMQAKVKQIQKHFLLNDPSKRYDALHMILHSIWLRRLNRKLDYERPGNLLESNK